MAYRLCISSAAGAQSGLMIDDGAIEHQLIGTGFRQQRLEAMTNLFRVTHQRARKGLLHRHQLTGRPLIAKLDDRRPHHRDGGARIAAAR